MPKPAKFSPLRLIAPGLLLVAFVLFFLPWIEVAAVDKTDRKTKEKTTKIAMSQSGLQIATAGYTISDPEMQKLDEAMKKADDGAYAKEREEFKAPVLFVYPVLLLAAIGLAFVPMPPMGRRLAVAGCSGLALLVALVFTSVALPVETVYRKKFEKGMVEFRKMNEDLRKQGGVTDGSGKKVDKLPEPEFPFRFPWQWAFYLTVLFLLGGIGTAFVDGGSAAPTRYGKKNRRRDEDEDDEDDRPRKKRRDDEDDEDDRPRKKKKPVAEDEDEDEDDRPRKKRPVAEDLPDDEDAPPPPKKRRRDEEEVEEPPRKKRPRDEEDEVPPKKRRRDEEEDEEPPRKKKPAGPAFEMPSAPPQSPPAAAPAGGAGNPFAFGDDEEVPKKKPRRRDDDEDEDDRPRKKAPRRRRLVHF